VIHRALDQACINEFAWSIKRIAFFVDWPAERNLQPPMALIRRLYDSLPS